jgi:hypothetical protein
MGASRPPGRRGCCLGVGTIAIAFCLAAAAAPQPAAAESPPATEFLDDRTLVLTVTPAGEFPVTDITLLNKADHAVQLTVTVVGLRSTTVPATAEIPVIEPAAASTDGSLAAGATWSPPMKLKVPSGARGTYSGRLVAYGSDGSIARRDFTVVVLSHDAGDVLREPLGDITIQSERLPFTTPDAATFRIDPDITSRLISTSLVDAEGRLASMTIHPDGRISLSAPDRGAFKGAIARKAVADETAPTKLAGVTWNIKDGWLLAAVLLAMGIGLALVLEWWTTDVLPRKSLDGRLDLQKSAAANHREDHQRWMASVETWPAPDRKAPRIDGPKSLMEGASKRAIEDFDDTPALDKRLEKWGAGGLEFLKVVGFVDSYSATLGLRKAIVSGWNRLLNSTPAAYRDKLQLSQIFRRVAEALEIELISSEARLNAAKASFETLDSKLSAFNAVADYLIQVAALPTTDPDHQQKVNRLWEELTTRSGLVPDELLAIQKKADDLASARPLRARQAVRPADALVATATFKPPPAVETLPNAEALLEKSAKVRESLQAWNLIFGVVIVAVVFIVGFTSQYIANVTFGSLADYLGILVWSFVGVSAAQLIKLGAGTIAPLFRSRPS